MSDTELDEAFSGYECFCRFKILPPPRRDDFEAGFRAARSASPPAPPVGGGEAVTWTTAKPKEPGLYLTESSDGWRGAARVSYADGEDGRLVASIIGCEHRIPLVSAAARWLGPLSVPGSPPSEGRSGGAEMERGVREWRVAALTWLDAEIAGQDAFRGRMKDNLAITEAPHTVDRDACVRIIESIAYTQALMKVRAYAALPVEPAVRAEEEKSG